MASKTVFAQQCQEVSTTLGQQKELIDALVKTWFDRGYNAGGTAIVDGDVAALGITAANIASFITMGQELQKFFGNLPGVAQADYQSTLSRMRTDV